MSEKYLCMHQGCNFMTDDEPEAIEHFELERGHDVLTVIMDDGRTVCHPIGIRSDSASDYDDFDEF